MAACSVGVENGLNIFVKRKAFSFSGLAWINVVAAVCIAATCVAGIVVGARPQSRYHRDD